MAEDNPNRIQVEIVLDDGSIQKGFAKISQASKETGTKVEKNLGDSLSDFKSSILSLPSSFAAIGAAVAAAGFAVKKAFDLTLEGENIQKLNKQFDILSKQAVGAGNDLRESIEKAGGGFIDTEEALKATNKVLIDFKGNASDIPKVLELSRKVSKVTGEDIVDIFSNIEAAIASQNTRLLKQYGLVIDSTKVQEDYAKSIGKTAKQLSEQEQRQAITNAALAFSNNQLKDISLQSDSATAAYKRLSVQLKELGDTAAVISSKLFGGIFSRLGNQAASVVESFNANAVATFGSGAEKSAAQIKVLEIELKRLQGTLEAQKQSQLGSQFTDETISRISKTTKELEILREVQNARFDDARRAETLKLSDKVGPDGKRISGSEIPENVKAAIKTSEDAAKARVLAENKANAEILANQVAADQALLNARIQSAEAQQGFESNFDLQRITQDAFFKEQERINEESQKAALLAIENKYAADKTLLVANKNKEIELINQQAMAREVAAAAAASKAKLAIDEKERTIKLQAVSTFFGGLASLQSSSSKELFEIGKVGAIAQATVNGYLAVTNALANIPAPFNIAAAAGIAIQTASQIAGITNTSFGGGGGSASVSGIDTSIGSSLNPSELTPEKDRERKPGEGLVVNVNGDILGDEASGRRLVDLMNAAFDASGVSLRQGLV